MTTSHPRLVMVGPHLDRRGALASAIGAYRAHGLFKRWPVEYLATNADGGVRTSAACALSALRRFAALLHSRRGLVVHVHAEAGAGFWREALFASLALVAGCPLILQLHGEGFARLHEHSGALGRRALQSLLERAACVIVPCASMKAWVQGVGRGANAVCIPYPVARSEARPEERPNLVLFLSRLEQDKGVFDLLQAVAELRTALPDVRLVCAGEGEPAAVRSEAERLGIADAVHVTGWVGPSARRALLESAAAFALPAYDEALPMALLEAMEAAVPVVASPVGGVPQFVADGITGLLVAPGDIATLRRQLERLLVERRFGARLAAAARESVRLRCEPTRVLASLEAVYATLGLQVSGGGEPALAPSNLEAS